MQNVQGVPISFQPSVYSISGDKDNVSHMPLKETLKSYSKKLEL